MAWLGPAAASRRQVRAERGAAKAAKAEHARYLLDCGRPRCSDDGAGIIYERTRVGAEFAADGAAIRWAREIIPHELGLTHRGEAFLAAPMVLRRGRVLVWEVRPGLALRIAG